jgi:hypothetical protein
MYNQTEDMQLDVFSTKQWQREAEKEAESERE